MNKIENVSICLVLILTICSSALSQSRRTQETFAAGDAARIQIYQLYENGNGRSPVANLSGDYAIDSNGYIFMPFAGHIRIANKTPEDVAELIKTKYATFLTDPFIYVRPLIRVTLRGSVSRPGSYRIDPKNSLWNLMDAAGGPVSNADLRKMFVVRGGRKAISNLLQAFEKAYSLKDVGIQSGDQIVIPQVQHFDFKNVVSYLSFAASAALLYIRLTE